MRISLHRFSSVASGPTAWRPLSIMDSQVLGQLLAARAVARETAWTQLCDTRDGLPETTAAGRPCQGWSYLLGWTQTPGLERNRPARRWEPTRLHLRILVVAGCTIHTGHRRLRLPRNWLMEPPHRHRLDRTTSPPTHLTSPNIPAGPTDEPTKPMLEPSASQRNQTDHTTAGQRTNGRHVKIEGRTDRWGGPVGVWAGAAVAAQRSSIRSRDHD
jgi:hypothetical protein